MTDSPFAPFAGQTDLVYACDDGMPFPDWIPPLLSESEARDGYAAGERIAVIAGDPANPVAGLVLDRRNAHLALRTADPVLLLVYEKDPLAVAEVTWWDAEGRECWGRRIAPRQVRVARRPRGAVLWVEELLAWRAADADPDLRLARVR